MTENPARYDLGCKVIALTPRRKPQMIDGDETQISYGPPAQNPALEGLLRSASIVRFPAELPPMICRMKGDDL